MGNTVFSVAGSGCPGKKPARPRRPRILLLYARDCELFMNMMTTFRQVLKEVTACEVRACVIYTEAWYDLLCIVHGHRIFREINRSNT